MTAGVLGAPHPEGEHEIGDLHTLDERDVMRAANLGLVLASPGADPEDVVAFHLAMGPAVLVGGLPAVTALLEVILEDHLAAGRFLGPLVSLVSLRTLLALDQGNRAGSEPAAELHVALG